MLGSVRRLFVANDPGWQRRSDDWVKMLEHSRLYKEKRLVDKEVLMKLKSRIKTEVHIH